MIALAAYVGSLTVNSGNHMDTGRRRSAQIVTLEQAAELGPPPPGNLATPVFAHGSLEVEWYGRCTRIFRDRTTVTRCTWSRAATLSS